MPTWWCHWVGNVLGFGQLWANRPGRCVQVGHVPPKTKTVEECILEHPLSGQWWSREFLCPDFSPEIELGKRATMRSTPSIWLPVCYLVCTGKDSCHDFLRGGKVPRLLLPVDYILQLHWRHHPIKGCGKEDVDQGAGDVIGGEEDGGMKCPAIYGGLSPQIQLAGSTVSFFFEMSMFMMVDTLTWWPHRGAGRCFPLTASRVAVLLSVKPSLDARMQVVPLMFPSANIELTLFHKTSPPSSCKHDFLVISLLVGKWGDYQGSGTPWSGDKSWWHGIAAWVIFWGILNTLRRISPH